VTTRVSIQDFVKTNLYRAVCYDRAFRLTDGQNLTHVCWTCLKLYWKDSQYKNKRKLAGWTGAPQFEMYLFLTLKVTDTNEVHVMCSLFLCCDTFLPKKKKRKYDRFVKWSYVGSLRTKIEFDGQILMSTSSIKFHRTSLSRFAGETRGWADRLFCYPLISYVLRKEHRHAT